MAKVNRDITTKSLDVIAHNLRNSSNILKGCKPYGGQIELKERLQEIRFVLQGTIDSIDQH